MNSVRDAFQKLSLHCYLPGLYLFIFLWKRYKRSHSDCNFDTFLRHDALLWFFLCLEFEKWFAQRNSATKILKQNSYILNYFYISSLKENLYSNDKRNTKRLLNSFNSCCLDNQTTKIQNHLLSLFSISFIDRIWNLFRKKTNCINFKEISVSSVFNYLKQFAIATAIVILSLWYLP